MSTVRDAISTAVSNQLAAAQQITTNTQTANPEKVETATAPTAATPAKQVGPSLFAAFASLGSRNSMVTDIVFGPNNQPSQIRVIDAVTHQVISVSPPDSIAHMQLEVQQYQDAAKNKLGST